MAKLMAEPANVQLVHNLAPSLNILAVDDLDQPLEQGLVSGDLSCPCGELPDFFYRKVALLPNGTAQTYASNDAVLAAQPPTDPPTAFLQPGLAEFPVKS